MSPSKYNTVSTMCSSTRGPASAFLGHVADQNHGDAGLLWPCARQLRRAFAHLGDRARRLVELVE